MWLQMTVFHSFHFNVAEYYSVVNICTVSSLSIHLSLDIMVAPMSWLL